MGIARSSALAAGPAGDDTALVAAITVICDEFEAYGWRRVQAALRRQGITPPCVFTSAPSRACRHHTDVGSGTRLRGQPFMTQCFG